MTSLDDLDLFTPQESVVPTPRKCRHKFRMHLHYVDGESHTAMEHPAELDGVCEVGVTCTSCWRRIDETRARRGKQSRNYGNRAELAVARKYGGEKVGHAGGPVDVRGKDFNVQVKTHRRPPPREWVKAFNAMSANRERLPRLLLRFVMGPGVPPEDYFVVPGKAWLDWFGRDE